MQFCLLDRVVELEPGVRITGVKRLRPDEDYLQDHFPRFPVMPGVLMLEAMYQASAWLVRQSEGFAHSMVVLKEGRGSFADALIGLLGAKAGCSYTVTFDRKAARISLTGVALAWHPLAGIALARASRLIRLHRLVVAVFFTSTATNFRIFHMRSFHGLRSVDNFD